MDEKYLKAAKKEMKRIAKELGHSPTSYEYRSKVAKEFTFKKLAVHDLTLNKLKIAAKVPINGKGYKEGCQTTGPGKQIFCLSLNTEISSNDCVPYYKKICNKCNDIQNDNRSSIPSLTAEEQRMEILTLSYGNKFSAGNDIYLTDNGLA